MSDKLVCKHCGRPVQVNEVLTQVLGRIVYSHIHDHLTSCFDEYCRCLGTHATPRIEKEKP